MLHRPRLDSGCCLVRCRELRECGLRCVEKVVAWVLHLDPEADEPTPFLWNGQVKAPQA
jgi:hypothetical protein